MMTEENNKTEENFIQTTDSLSSDTTTIGDLIKNKREEKGLSLKVISQQTKIHIGLLGHLENNQFDKLPSKAYVRGFVKSTSKILGLDQEYALELLDMAYAKKEAEVTPTVSNLEMKAETARNTLTPMAESLEAVKSVTASSTIFLIKTTVVILIIGVVGFNVKNYLEKSEEEVEVKLPEVISTLQRPAAPVEKSAPTPEVKPVEPEESIQVNIIKDQNQKMDVVINDINLKTISLGEKQLGEKTIPQEKYDELLPAKYRVEPTKGIDVLFLNATEGDSWLTYKVDDKEIKKFVLRQGRTLFLRGSLIRIFIGNTRALSAFHNNKAVDLSVGSKGGVKNLVLPEEMKTKYMAPLFVFKDDGTVVTSDEFLKSNEGKEQKSKATPMTEASGKIKTP